MVTKKVKNRWVFCCFREVDSISYHSYHEYHGYNLHAHIKHIQVIFVSTLRISRYLDIPQKYNSNSKIVLYPPRKIFPTKNQPSLFVLEIFTFLP